MRPSRPYQQGALALSLLLAAGFTQACGDKRAAEPGSEEAAGGEAPGGAAGAQAGGAGTQPGKTGTDGGKQAAKPANPWGSTEADVVDWVAERAAAAGLRLSGEAAAVLAARVGAETRQIDNEIEKLSLTFGNDVALTVEQVRELVPITRAGGIFDLSNARKITASN